MSAAIMVINCIVLLVILIVDKNFNVVSITTVYAYIATVLSIVLGRYFFGVLDDNLDENVAGKKQIAALVNNDVEAFVGFIFFRGNNNDWMRQTDSDGYNWLHWMPRIQDAYSIYNVKFFIKVIKQTPNGPDNIKESAKANNATVCNNILLYT